MRLLALILFIVLPIVEIYLFIKIGGALGAGWTILLIFITAAIGLSAMRRQGLAVLQEAQAAQAAGRAPLAAAAHGILILLAGGLLIIPGFFTDTLGLLFLWRPARLFFISAALEALLPHIVSMRPQAGPRPSADGSDKNDRGDTLNKGGQTIEGDYRVDDE